MLVTVIGLSGLFVGISMAARSPGAPDPSFGRHGRVTTAVGGRDDGDHFSDAIRGIAPLSHGRILAVGSARSDFALALYRRDGHLDRRFGGGDGKVLTDLSLNLPFFDRARAVAIQKDGRIVVAGESHRGPSGRLIVARYLRRGRLDRSFGGDGIVAKIGYGAFDVALQDDGKIVVVGILNVTPGTPIVLRFNRDGTRDMSFGHRGRWSVPRGKRDEVLFAVAIQSDGKVVMAGASYNKGQHGLLIRLTARGRLDHSFGKNGSGRAHVPIGSPGSPSYLTDLVLQRDGRIVVTGSYSGESAVSSGALVARYGLNGRLDHSFGHGDGIVRTSLAGGFPESVAIQRDGRILVAGAANPFPRYVFALLRYLSDGSPDESFGKKGLTRTSVGKGSRAFAVAVQRDGRIVAGGRARVGDRPRFALVRYLAG